MKNAYFITVHCNEGQNTVRSIGSGAQASLPVAERAGCLLLVNSVDSSWKLEPAAWAAHASGSARGKGLRMGDLVTLGLITLLVALACVSWRRKSLSAALITLAVDGYWMALQI
jgi:hypothetical protein